MQVWIRINTCRTSIKKNAFSFKNGAVDGCLEIFTPRDQQRNVLEAFLLEIRAPLFLKSFTVKTSLVVLHSQNYAAGMRRHYYYAYQLSMQ